MSRPIRRAVISAVAFAAGLWACDRMLTARSVADDGGASTTLPATAPATRPAYSADVQAIVDRLVATYAQTPLRLEGEIVSDFDVAGIKRRDAYPLVAAYDGGRFRHEATGQLLLVADARTLHVYDVANNTYDEAKLADAGGETAREMLAAINPALWVAVAGDAGAAVSIDAAADVTRLASVDEEGRTFDRLESIKDGAVRRVWIDAERGTIDRIETDFADLLKAQGAAAVGRAVVTIRYAKTEFGGPAVDASQFSFTPPADATPAAKAPEGEMLADAGGLEGKPAPAFELNDLDGKPAKLSDHAGSVVVLDFWATWCPPCRKGLPHLAKTAKTFAERGVKVFAVNVQEDAATVRKFLADQALDLHALLDADGAVGKRYGVSGIPQTVVIGRDGKVTKVIVGFDQASAGALDQAVEAALK